VAAEQVTTDRAYAAHLERKGLSPIVVVSATRSKWQKRGGSAGAHRASFATTNVSKHLLDVPQCALHGLQELEKDAVIHLVDHCLGGETS
jgi:hypothetical protein